jgi:hypothetical protein
MNKKTTAAAAALLISAAAFADGFSVSGYLRAGLSSTLESTPAMSTKTWLSGIYFNGDSSATRARLNIAWDGSSASGNSYGSFIRLQYTGTDDGASENWGVGSISYAQAYAGLFGNVVTVAAGKIKDNWIGSAGFEGYSVLDGKSGAVVTVTPVKGLNLTGAAIIDPNYVPGNTISMNGDTFLGGVKYKNDMFTAMASFAGYGLFVGNVVYTGTKGLLVSAETKIDTDHGFYDTLKDQRALVDEQIQYTGIDNWTFGLLSFQYFNQKSVAGDSDVTIKITPAAAYQLTSDIRLSVEGTYTMPVYDNAPKGYATIVPAVKLSADKIANVYVWSSISTDQSQSKNSVGLGVIREF